MNFDGRRSSPIPGEITEDHAYLIVDGCDHVVREPEGRAARLLPDIQAYVRLKVGPDLQVRESCSDIVQSVCREIFADLTGWQDRGEGSFRAWVFTLALNKVREGITTISEVLRVTKA